ncbi:unnamed protein product [Trichogramma brassicae]|uniref:Uncharacterized protein n=1 Tax=Trichogramma brassicae TaxID=86971 RepID=A0A6H5IX04_9HYME|nr:unnamed protein product [Trichogramma brassicae]
MIEGEKTVSSLSTRRIRKESSVAYDSARLCDRVLRVSSIELSKCGMWTKIESMSAEDVMASLRDKKLSGQGGEQFCRERLFRARLKRLPATFTHDVPWDVNLDDLPDQVSLCESVLDQTMIELSDDAAKKLPEQVNDSEKAMFEGDFEARLMSMILEAVRREVNRALGERAKPPVEVAGADVLGALGDAGLRRPALRGRGGTHWQCDRGERGDAPVERSDLDEITLVSSECVAAPHFSTQDRVCEEESEPEEAHEIITRAEIHEMSEKRQAEDGRQRIYIDIAAMSQENRFFVNVQVGKFTYRALKDSGVQCCLAGPKMMQDLADRIMPSPTVIGFANSQDDSSSGCVPVMMQIDREAGRVVFECVEILPMEMVLGADFGRRWKIDIGMGRDQWRLNDGPWHDFAKPSEAKGLSHAITAECTGITVKPSERELVLQKVMRLIPNVSG